jgi:hypothetical protein
MNGKQIMDKAITYNSDELDSIKEQLAAVLDKMIVAIPTLKTKMTDLDIKAQADSMIRSQFRRVLNGKDNYFVERNGQKAMIGLDAATANAIVKLFNEQI